MQGAGRIHGFCTRIFGGTGELFSELFQLISTLATFGRQIGRDRLSALVYHADERDQTALGESNWHEFRGLWSWGISR